MAEAAIIAAVRTFGDLAIPLAISLSGVKEKVTRMGDEIRRMQSVITDADRSRRGDRVTINTLISDIRNVAHDATDAIDIFRIKVEALRSNQGRYRRYLGLPNYMYHLYKVGTEIDSIHARLNDIARTCQISGIIIQNVHDDPEENELQRARRLCHWETDNDVVGLEDDVKLLVGQVVNNRGDLSITSIVGMGGIGKSTLAREVYNDPAVVAAGFDHRAWVIVSSAFDPQGTMKNIYLQLLPEREKLTKASYVDHLTLEQVKGKIKECLLRKRYIIVLDDVWEKSDWQHMANAFPKENTGSTLLLTSRRTRNISYNARHDHPMKRLDEQRSWELFSKKAFKNNEGQCPEHLEIVAREISKKCCGLPLAIVVLGGLFADKNLLDANEWEKVWNEIRPLLHEESIVSRILDLSYRSLSPELKSCFLCLGFFKEDAIIPAKKLVQVWIAQGLIQQEVPGGRTLEEIGRSYLDDLINQSMVQVKDMSKIDRRVKSCQIHDLLRDLSIQKAKQEIRFEIINDALLNTLWWCLEKPRHRVIEYKTESFIYSTVNNKNNKRIRSLFLCGTGEIKIEGNPSYWKNFRLLTILNFEDGKLENLPDTIGKLTELRYLGLRGTWICKVPRSFGSLKKLEVLDIAAARPVEMPNVIWKMESLRHLYMSIHATFEEPGVRIDTLTNLQTVSYINVDDSMLQQLSRLTSLWKLGINLDRYERQVCSPLESLVYVTHLKLEGSLVNIPNATNFPPNLACLTLRGARLHEDPMPVLEQLPNLLSLKLDRAYQGEEMVVSKEGFPKLQVLILRGMSNLKNIGVGEEGGMPKLKRLEIFNCRSLQLPIENLRLSTRTTPKMPKSKAPIYP